MALPTSEQEWLTALASRHDAELPQLRAYNDEYELRSPHVYMHPEVLQHVEERLQQVIVAWPELVVGSLEERLDVEGFRLPDEAEADAEMWRVWQANDADEGSQLAHLDALVMRRAYGCVGTNAEDEATPLVTFESPLEVYADVDPRDRTVRAALRRWCDNADSLTRLPERYSTLYLPNATIFYEYGQSGWNEIDRDNHGMGVVPVVPYVNRNRLADLYGRSELHSVLPLTHAMNKLATDMMVAAEFVAIPLRGFLGVGPDAFVDVDGNQLTAMQVIMGRMLAVPDPEGVVKSFEFAAAQLSNFTVAADKLAQLVSSIGGLPVRYMGMAGENPPSADSIRSDEARLVKRAERRQRGFGGSHERLQRLVRRFQAGDWDPRLLQLETIWRDASTPTVAQKADAAVKLYNLPKPIVPLRQTREDLGYTDVQIKRMEDEDQRAMAADPLAALTEALGQGQPAEVAGAVA